MKSLYNYILEALENNITELTNMKVIFDCPSKYYIEVPVKYSESDIQVYMDDVLLKDMPSETERAKKLFMDNAENISDVHFEYDSIDEAVGNNQTADLTWNETYDNNANGDDRHIMQVNNLKYIIEFEKFILKDIDKDKITETVNTLFNSCVSNTEHEWNITISLNVQNITFDYNEGN